MRLKNSLTVSPACFSQCSHHRNIEQNSFCQWPPVSCIIKKCFDDHHNKVSFPTITSTMKPTGARKIKVHSEPKRKTCWRAETVSSVGQGVQDRRRMPTTTDATTKWSSVATNVKEKKEAKNKEQWRGGGGKDHAKTKTNINKIVIRTIRSTRKKNEKEKDKNIPKLRQI